MPNRRLLTGAVAIGALALTSCGDDSTTECVSSEHGEVCATSADGAITFDASGLEPGSQVEITMRGDEQPATYDVQQDGTLLNDPGALGFLSALAGATLEFSVDAVDGTGAALRGNIEIST